MNLRSVHALLILLSAVLAVLFGAVFPAVDALLSGGSAVVTGD